MQKRVYTIKPTPYQLDLPDGVELYYGVTHGYATYCRGRSSPTPTFFERNRLTVNERITATRSFVNAAVSGIGLSSRNNRE